MDPVLKRIINAFAGPFILALLILVIAAAWRLSQPTFQPGSTPSISVSGEGRVRVKPDVAIVNFAVVNQGTDPEVIQKGNDARMASAIEFLKSQAVKAEDIKTVGYNLTPQYEADKDGTRPPRIVGYTLTQTVSAKIRALENVGKLVGELPDKGVNQIASITFTVDDPTPFRNQAREEAIAKARLQAKNIASGLGVRVGRVVSFYESPVFIPVPFEAGIGGFGKGGGGEVAPIQPGTEEIAISVNITYALR